MNTWLKQNLACPRDRKPLSFNISNLTCPDNHQYPLIDNIPIMLIEEVRPTQHEFTKTLEQVASPPAEKARPSAVEIIDPFVQNALGATGGAMYKSIMKRLTTYPIPKLRQPSAQGQYFLDIGCNWGRWCVSAAREGYIPIGIDHNLDAIRAAHRVARQLKTPTTYLVADARHLPFSDNCFNTVFSYSVLQHFSKSDARQAIAEAGRVLKPSGRMSIQMPNAFGMRNIFVQLMRGFKEPEGFDVRYWTPRELQETFQQLIGVTSLQVDGYFSLNVQASDLPFLSPRHRPVVIISELLRKISTVFPPIKYLADSFYVEATR